MRIVVQRSKEAFVKVNKNIVGQISHGLVLLVAFTDTDTALDISYSAKKIANLRIFEDDNQKMNLCISQFIKCVC